MASRADLLTSKDSAVFKGHVLALGTGSTSRSYELESWAYVQHKDYKLQLLQKSDKSPVTRPTIPTSEWERLAYVRNYTTAPFKLQRMYLQQLDSSACFWLHITNVILRSLPINYIHLFLAAYNPDEHLFLSKMVPVFAGGVSWQIVICGILQLVASVDILSLLLYYAVSGLVENEPWNQCFEAIAPATPTPYKYQCYNLEEFANLTAKYIFIRHKHTKPGKTKVNFAYNYYVWDNGTNWDKWGVMFTSAPQAYFLELWSSMDIQQSKEYQWAINFILLWVLAGAFYKQIYRNYPWKVLNYAQGVLSVTYLLLLGFIICYYLEHDVVEFPRHFKKSMMDFGKGFDYDMQAESISGPPIVHLLAARSGEQVNPGRDSFILTASNSLFYITKGLINYKIKSYLESFNWMPVIVSETNPYPIFYFWPIFFHNMVFGSFMIRVFYALTLFVEFLTFVLTFQLIIEVIVCEWKWTQRGKATVVVTVIGITISCAFITSTKFYMYLITTAITSLTEAVMLCWMYPLGRLTSDMHFQFGTPPWRIRIWSLRLLPVYYVYKGYYLYKTIAKYLRKYERSTRFRYLRGSNFSAASWVWVIPVVPLPLGALYAVYRHIFKEKTPWISLFIPKISWGPRDHVARQLRKKFDSREYVGSQASRYLSRHLLAKAETPTYRLDVKYEGRASYTVQNTLI